MSFMNQILNQISINWVPDLIGCLGTVIILITYYLLQARKLLSTSLSYSFLNLGGALLIFISLMYSWNLPAVLMEVAWILISLFGILKDLLTPLQKNPAQRKA